jgi:hypothetical protein
MASYTTKIQSIYAWSGTGTGSISGQATDQGGTFTSTVTTFPASSTNASLTLAFTKANLQSSYIVADQNCTIKTNSSGSPSETITLVAGIPHPTYKWSKSSGVTNPWTTDVTTAFVTCTSATTIKIGILQS